MSKMNRRQFLKTSFIGAAGISIAGPVLADIKDDEQSTGGVTVDKVKLGGTGLEPSRIAMGTGTIGTRKSSNQTRLGMETFVKMAHHAYDRGIRFFDMADMYGSHPFVGRAMRSFPRENVILMSKMWTQPDGSENIEDVRRNIDRFRLEMGTDYIDLLMMHCMMQGDWDKTRTHYMEGFSKAKEEGIVRRVGVSCHNLDALKTAAVSPWVDAIVVRINPFGTNMDAEPAKVAEAIEMARNNGKGVIGMKIFGEGKHITESERERSIRYAIKEAGVHSMTIGMESIAQIDENIAQVMRIAGS